MEHRYGRVWAGPVATAALLASAWTVPLLSTPEPPSGVTVIASPQLRGAGAAPEAAGDAGYHVDVDVDGAPAGQSVELEMWSDGSWRHEDEGLTDASGSIRLEASSGGHGRIITEVGGSSVTRTFDAVAVGPVLYWNEEFTVGYRAPEWLVVPAPDDGLTCTLAGEAGTEVSEGQLVLTVVEEPNEPCEGNGPLLVNGHLALRAEVGYGTTAARIKLPRGRAVVGQFWLQPGDPVQRWAMDHDHPGVVIVETRGTGRDPRTGTSVNEPSRDAIKVSSELFDPAKVPSDGLFHVYAVTWTPEGFSFSVDGDVVRTVATTAFAPPLTIGLAVTPANDRPVADEEDVSMYVDWLRVWGPQSTAGDEPQ